MRIQNRNFVRTGGFIDVEKRPWTEEEVRKIEEQRELQLRAQRAMDPNALYNDRMKMAHEAAMERRRERIIANPNAETDTTLRHSVLRNEEMRLARDHEMRRLGEELSTRRQESEDKKEGMIGQGSKAAEFNADAVKRKAEKEAASAMSVAETNAKRDVDIAGITTKSNEKINEDKNDAAVEIAQIQGRATVDAEGIKAEDLAAQRMAERLMRERKMSEQEQTEAMKELRERAERLMKEAEKSGKRISPEKAMQMAKQYMEKWDRMPGRKLDQWRQ